MTWKPLPTPRCGGRWPRGVELSVKAKRALRKRRLFVRLVLQRGEWLARLVDHAGEVKAEAVASTYLRAVDAAVAKLVAR